MFHKLVTVVQRSQSPLQYKLSRSNNVITLNYEVKDFQILKKESEQENVRLKDFPCLWISHVVFP